MPSPHDALFKAVFSLPDQAAAHLASALPPEVVRHLDLGRVAHVDGSFVDEALTERHSDVLLRVGTTWGTEALVYVLFEHQSTPDPRMPFRLLAYMVRVWQRFLDEHPEAQRLPPVIPLVLYHGHAPWNVAPSLREQLDVPAHTRSDLSPWLADVRYVLEDLSTVPDASLHGLAWGQMALWLFKHYRAGEVWLRSAEWLDTLAETRSQSGLRAVETVLRYMMSIDDAVPPNVQRKLVERVGPEAAEVIVSWADKLVAEGLERGLEQGRAQGREEGREEGALQGARDTLLRLLRLRFGPLSADVASRVGSATPSDLEGWEKRLFIARSLDDVFAR